MASLVAKLQRRPGDSVLLVGAPPALIDALSEGSAAVTVIEADRVDELGAVDPVGFGAIHLFACSQAQLADLLHRLRPVLAPGGRLWASWPKGRRDGTDLVLPEVIRIAYDHDLVESNAISLDDYWSALKLTRPIPGKQYRNSYGVLPSASRRNGDAHRPLPA